MALVALRAPRQPLALLPSDGGVPPGIRGPTVDLRISRADGSEHLPLQRAVAPRHRAIWSRRPIWPVPQLSSGHATAWVAGDELSTQPAQTSRAIAPDPSPSLQSSVARTRRAYIDWARGFAVLLMIEAHVFDAWTRPSARAEAAFGWAAVLAGFAAPLFLWLAGLSAILSAARTERRSHSRAVAVEAVCRRGLELFILAFLFRLQAFIVTPGSHPITLFRVDILNVMGPAVVAAGLIWGLCRAPRFLVVLYGVFVAAADMLTPMVRTSVWVNARLIRLA